MLASSTSGPTAPSSAAATERSEGAVGWSEWLGGRLFPSDYKAAAPQGKAITVVTAIAD